MAEYIEREDAKKALIGWDTDPTDEEIEYALDNIPTADVVEVVHGKWVAVEYNDGSVFKECSNCGARKQQRYYNFCPHCGAKMDGKGD